MTSSATAIATMSCRCRRVRAGVGLARSAARRSRVQPSGSNPARDGQLFACRLVDVNSQPGRLGRPRRRRADGRSMLRDCATSAFLSGSPCAMSVPSGATTSAKPCSPMRMPVDHPPHLFEAELADQPAGRLVEARQRNGEDARRQQVVVDADRRHRDAVEDERRVASGSRRCGAPTRLVATTRAASSNSVISRNSRNCRT